MAKKATITPVTDTALNAGAINTQLNAINNKLDNTLSLDGSTPNAMAADLDLNSNDILNAKDINAARVLVGGSLITPSSVVVNANNVNLTPTGAIISTDVQAAFGVIGTTLYKTVADLLASTEPSHGVGSIWEAGGFRYIEVASGGDVVNAAPTPVQLDVQQNQNGTYTLEAFGDTTIANAQTVFAAAAASVVKGIIECVSAAYTTTATIAIPSNIQFIGLGAGSSGYASSISYSGSGKAVTYESTVSGTPTRWGGISKFRIINTALSTDILYLQQGWNGIFEDLTLVGNSKADFCIRLQAKANFGTYYNTFTRVECISSLVANLDVDGDTDSNASRANNNRFMGCRFDSGAGIGIRLAGCDGIDFFGSNVEGNTGTGLVVGVTARTAPIRVNFFGGYIENTNADIDASLASTGGNGGVNLFATRFSVSIAKIVSGSICNFFGGEENGHYANAATDVKMQFMLASETTPSLEIDGRGRLAYEITGTAQEVLGAKVLADANNRIEIINGGELRAGSGAAITDIALKRRNSTIKHWQDHNSDSVLVSDRTTGGAASAGAGNQYILVRIGDNEYKLLHDGEAAIV